jgi:tRNAThr (cytosine32-N3)-methyltransferase
MHRETHPEAVGRLQELSNNVSKLELSPSPPVSSNGNTASPSEVDTSSTTTTTTTTTPVIPTHRSHDPTTNAKRTDPFQFGQRYLEPDDDVFAYNAWDHVDPDPAHQDHCQQQYAQQRLHPVSAFDRTRFNASPAKWWDLFYKQKSSTFFKDRRWLRQEFPVLESVTRKGAGTKVVLEVGAGAGNTAFPLVRSNENDELRVRAVDFSARAVETMRASEEYDEGKGVLKADVWDVAAAPAATVGEDDGDENDATLPPSIQEGSVDVVIMIFIFSALSPEQWGRAVRNIHRVLKPGGEVLFRDYGRGDLAQVRFKAGRWMGENFYVRGDGTRVYFFDKEELARIWAGDGKGSDEEKEEEASDAPPRFEILNLDVDRRLIVNRQKKIKMYRCWIQGRFRKSDRPRMMADCAVVDGVD